VYAEVIRLRPVSLSVALIGAAQLGLSCIHCGMPCGFHAMTGLPCPGCGLTRSVMALFQGHVTDSFLLHPFGPPLLAALIVALVAGVLPAPARHRLARAIETVEAKTGITLLALVVFMLMWTLRISGVLHLAQI
jgi:hypothetical protein